MTPQEQQMVDDLFDRLAKLEINPRDGDAERLIAARLQRAPHAVYALVQTALVQDEALRRANAQIEELQSQVDGGEAQHQQQGGFLDSMRDAVLGRRDTRGSVPSVHAQAAPSSWTGAPGYQPQPGYPPAGNYPAGPGAGGSFLGTAASAAAGTIGGALLLDSIRSMFGRQSGAGGQDQSIFGRLGNQTSGDQTSPWSRGAGNNELSRELGVNDIGRGGAGQSQATQDAAQDAAQDAEEDNSAWADRDAADDAYDDDDTAGLDSSDGDDA